MKSSLNVNRGFSLIELLIVVAIMALLVGLSIPAVNDMLRASHLSSAGQTMVDLLNNARQTALSRGLPVEVRFYKLPDYSDAVSASPAVFRAVQSFVLDDTNTVPLIRPAYFANPVICSSDATQSSIFQFIPETNSPNPLPTYGINYRYCSLVFKPSGAVSLPNTNVFVTLLFENGKTLSEGANFFSIQIDALTGRTRLFRP